MIGTFLYNSMNNSITLQCCKTLNINLPLTRVWHKLSWWSKHPKKRRPARRWKQSLWTRRTSGRISRVFPPTWPYRAHPIMWLHRCALWGQSHRLHLNRGGGGGGGVWGEHACVRSPYTSAHAPRRHGNKHLPDRGRNLSRFFLLASSSEDSHSCKVIHRQPCCKTKSNLEK